MSRLFSTSTRLSSSMYSHTRLYRFCMLSGADQKNSGVSSTYDGGIMTAWDTLHSVASTAKHPLNKNWLTHDQRGVLLTQVPQSEGSSEKTRTVDSRLTPAFWMNTLPMSCAISLRSRVTRPAAPKSDIEYLTLCGQHRV